MSGSEIQAQPVGPWKVLADRLDFSRYAPEPAAPAEERHVDSKRWGRQLILKSTSGQYLQLGESDEFLWRNMDGAQSVQELVLLYFHRYESFAFDRISHLIGRLREHGLLKERPVEAFRALAKRLERHRPEAVFSRLASMFIEHRMEVRGLDRVLSFFHRWFFWPFFSRPAYALYIILAALGTSAFVKVLLDGRFEIRDVFTSEGSVAYGAVALSVAFTVMAAIHQLSHIFAAKALGREVPCAGFMITYGLPFVFAQTTDVWLEGRFPRIASSLAGTVSDLLVGSAAALFLVACPQSDWAPLVFKLAAVSYAALFMDLNPLFEMDGYYALEDYLEIPGLRAKSLAFVRGELWRKLREREHFDRQERIFSVYGILAVGWLVVLVTSVIVFLVTKFEASVTDILHGTSWGSVVMALAAMVFFVIPLLVALLAFAALAIWRAVRWMRTHPALRDPRRLTHAILACMVLVCAVILIVPRLAMEVVELPVAATYFGQLEEALSRDLFMPIWGLVFPAIVPGVFAASFVLAMGASREVAGSRLSTSVRLLAAFCATEVLRAAWGSYSLTWGIATPLVGMVGVALESLVWVALFFWAGHLLFRVELRLMKTLPRILLGIVALTAVLGAAHLGSQTGHTPLGSALVGLAAASFTLATVAILSTLVNYSRTMLWPGWVLLLAAMGARNVAGVGRLTDRVVLSGIQVDLIGAVLVLFSLLLLRTILRLSSVRVSRRKRTRRDEPGDRARLLDALAFIIESLAENLYQAYGRRTSATMQREFNTSAAAGNRSLRLRDAAHGEDSSHVRLDTASLDAKPIIAIEEEGRWALGLIERQAKGLAGTRFFTQLMTAAYDELYWSEREPVYEHLLRGFDWTKSIARVPAIIETSVDELIEGTPLFEGLTLNERRSLAGTLRHRRVGPAEMVVREGDAADAFYLIADGSLEVFHDDAPNEAIATLTRGDYFGEATALDNARRSASVRARTDAELLVLDRTDFRSFARSHISVTDRVEDAKEVVALLRTMPAFREVPLAQLALMASLMKSVRLLPGTEVIAQGEIGTSMYIIRQGQVEVVAAREGAVDRRVAVLGPGEYFGEIALVESVPRTATVKTLTECELYALSKEDFDRRIGRSIVAIQALGRISSRRRREIHERTSEFEFAFSKRDSAST
jgi:putative peptide zinc metalloprotease protein